MGNKKNGPLKSALGWIWLGVVLGTLGSQARATTAPPEVSFTVLCYHRFIQNPDTVKSPLSEYRLPLDEFKWQMQYLKDHGITPVSFEQLKAHLLEGKPLPDRAVLLTFDDGFRSIYKAYPVIRSFGYPAVFFAYTDFVKSQGDSLRYSEIEEMKDHGWAIESHTKSHLNLGLEEEKRTPEDFAKLVAEEFSEPLSFIWEKFGRRSTALAYPYGVYDDEILEATKNAGYKLAFTVNPGPNDRTVPLLRLKRNLVLYPMKRENFAAIFRDRVLHLKNIGPGDGEVIENKEPIISAEIQDEVVPETVELRMGNKILKSQYNPAIHLLRYQAESPMKAGGHMVTISAKDRDGQSRVYTWYFRIRHKRFKSSEAKFQDRSGSERRGDAKSAENKND